MNGINITQSIKSIGEFLNVCALQSDQIVIGPYVARCFTWGLVVAVILIILVIGGWEGL